MSDLTGFFPIFAIIVFAAVVLLVEGLYSMWNTYRGPEAQKIAQRLMALSAGADRSELTAVLKNRLLSEVPAIEHVLLAIPRINKLDRFIMQSGLEWKVAKLLWLALLVLVIVYILLSVAGVMPLLRLGFAVSASFLPWAYVQWRRSRRLHRIEQQLPDTLDLIGRALRAGHALPAALHMVGDEMPDPIAGEFRTMYDEINFGISMQQALANLGERVPSTDLRYFVVAVLVQREAGGNLTEVLDNLSTLIHNRLKFHAKVRVLSTEGRMSAWVLGLLPFLLAGVLNLANHDFISILWTDPIGIMISNILIGMMALGGIWLYKLTQIRV